MGAAITIGMRMTTTEMAGRTGDTSNRIRIPQLYRQGLVPGAAEEENASTTSSNEM